MASMTLKASDVCAAGTHVTLTVTGDVSHVVRFSLPEFLDPLTEAEKDAFVLGIVRFAKIGRTAAQIKTALLNGVTVTI